MSDYYDRRSTRRGSETYASSYAPPRSSYDREPPYDSLYRRSFDAVPSDNSSSSDRYRPSSHGRDARSSIDSSAYGYRADRQLNRRDGYSDYSDSYNSRAMQRQSQGGYSEYEDASQYTRDSQDYGGEERERLAGLVGKEKKDIAATVIGAAAGALLGHEAGHGKGFGTLGGALLGGLSANAIEHQHLK
ncbi:MAG: hypothetical protein Q9162_007102 [Coniocarpon cinnabarinum]